MNSRRQVPRRERASQGGETRTVAVVVVASLGAGLMAFVLGINVGLDRTPAEAPPSENSVLRTLDSQASKLREVRARERTELSFHDALTGPARPARQRPAPAPVAVVAPASTVAPSPAPAVEVPAAPESPAEPAALAAAEPVTADNDDATAPTPEPEVQAVASHFSLQVGAFPDENSASSLRQRLQSKGYQVRIATSDIEGKGTWYRVRVGRFDDRAAAEDQRTRLSSSEGLFALVVPET